MIHILQRGSVETTNQVFLRLVLDQGYHPAGLWTAPTSEALRRDILSAQAMGFNGARLHQKVFEPSYFAHADELGFLVSWIHRHTKLLCLLCPTWVLLVFFGREEYHLASRTTKFQNLRHKRQRSSASIRTGMVAYPTDGRLQMHTRPMSKMNLLYAFIDFSLLSISKKWVKRSLYISFYPLKMGWSMMVPMCPKS